MGQPIGSHGLIEDVGDGTNPRMAMPSPVPLGADRSKGLIEYARRLGYVDAAWTRCQVAYAEEAIVKQVGEDATEILQGVLAGLFLAMGILVLTTGIGAVVGGAVGALGAGVGAIPGAVAGADFGLVIGNGILAWAGLGLLGIYIGSHLGDLGRHFRSAIARAWDSGGDRMAIDVAAREFAEGLGLLLSLLLQALVVFLTKGAAKQGTGVSLAQLRDSLLFKRCPRLEPWLVKNFPRLRAKYVPLKWVLLGEGPRIPGSTIPESVTIKVGERVFEVIRNKDKIDPRTGEPIGPALKHLGEREIAGTTDLKQGPRDPGVKLHSSDARNWPASEWAKNSDSLTSFPMSSLAAALDQAEAQLMFKVPDPRAKPVGLGNWELIIDTTRPVWRVFHAEYKSRPLW